jgi:hypothetical protein
MKNTIISLTALALGCCSAAPSFAQYDSSRLDLGYLHLKRDFTQIITIKGADLEKMPFANLSEAIAAWFYGAYTTPVTLQYVVDGNPVSDVNAYSVYDIEEVVLVQNAAALVNTADGQQELVIVRTKRGQGKGGVMADAQTGWVNSKEYGETSELRVYHNYYLTAWRNVDKVSYGLSGNYLRDVFPFADNGLDVTAPDNLQRWRLNGYFTWRPNSHNQVEIMLNYTPERTAFVFQNPGQPTTYLLDDHSAQHFILPRLLWHSDLSSKWTNDLQATYIHSTARLFDYNNDVVQLPNDSLEAQYNGSSDLGKSYHLWVRDHLGYKATAGHWSIEPAINASYEHFSEQNDVGSVDITSAFNGGSLGLGPLPNVSDAIYSIKENLIVLTPSLDISYKRLLDMQGGVLLDAGHQQGIGGRDAFPFASLSLDLLRLGNDNGGSGLKVFGSYASRTAPSPQGYLLGDLSSGDYNQNSPVQDPDGDYLNTTANYTVPSYPPSPVYWVWETGASYTGWKDRLTIEYNFERRNFVKTAIIYPPAGSSYPIGYLFPEWESTVQHVDIRVKVLDTEGVRWLTSVNGTLLQNKSHFAYADYPGYEEKQDIGDDAPSPASCTGGWVNRLQLKRFTAGFDLLYHFRESVQSETSSGTYDTVKVNSVITPNIYIGYNWNLRNIKTLECFVESRGLFRNSTNDLLDERRYYTVGGKLSL